MIPDWRVSVLGAAAGLALGSFVVTAALRWTQARSAVLGRSQCDGCGIGLGFAATLPIVSYIRLRGVCASCGARIDPMHAVAEIAGGLSLLGALTLDAPLRQLIAAVMGLLLLASSVIDAKTRRLPNALTLGAGFCAMGLAASRSLGRLELGLAWAAGASAVMLAIWALVRRTPSEPGIGLGDVKLVAALAIWLGPATPWMIVLAAMAGLAAHAAVRPKVARLPFGPALAGAAWIVGLAAEGSWLTT